MAECVVCKQTIDARKEDFVVLNVSTGESTHTRCVCEVLAKDAKREEPSPRFVAGSM